MKSSSCTSLVFIRIPLRVVPPLENAPPLSEGRKGGVVLLGAEGVSPRNHSLVRGSGTAVLRGFVASAQRTGYAF
jgi:hypothetical protein